MKCFEVPYSLPKLMPPSTLFHNTSGFLAVARHILSLVFFKGLLVFP